MPEDPPTAERARVLAQLGGALMGAGRWAESRTLCEAAIDCAGKAGARSEESRARNLLGSDLVALGEIDAGIEQLRMACAIAAEVGPADMLILGHFNLALNLLTAGRLDEALPEAEAGRRAARAAGLERRFGQDLVALTADILLRLGRVPEAGEVVREGLALDPAGEGTVYLSIEAARLASIRGDAAEARRRLGAIDLDAVDPDVAASAAAVAAEAYAWEGRPADALEMAEARPAPAGGPGRRPVDRAARVARPAGVRGAGRHGAARPGWPVRESPPPAVARLRSHLEAIEGLASTTSGRGSVALARGELARIEGTEEDGAWSAAIEAFDAVPEPLLAAYARVRAAEAALRTHGLRADVGRLLGDASAIAEAAGARPLGDAVAELAARARIQLAAPVGREGAVPAEPVAASSAAPDPRAAAAALGLSAREIEVLELLVAGRSNGEIAERLFITRKTAAVHVTHILDKLGVSNRVGAAMIGARVGLGADRTPEDYAGSE